MKADDMGRYHANVKILKSTLFPYEADKLRDSKVKSWLSECEKHGIVAVYEIDGEEFLEIQKFNQRVRILKLKYPAPLGATDEKMTVICQSHDGHMTDTCQTDDGLNETNTNLKRNEVEEETKVPPTANNDYLNKFFSEEGSMNRTQVAFVLREAEIPLRWGEVFNAHLHTQSRVHFAYAEWMKHFLSWLRKALPELKEVDRAKARHKARNYLN